MRIAGVWAALLIGTASLQAQEAQDAATCRAERRGEALITKIEYADGYGVEGPWRVMEDVRAGTATTVRAVLDRIVETRSFTSRRQMTALPTAIEMTFRGRSIRDLLDEAANVWCLTVMKARASIRSWPTKPNEVAQNRLM
jgi:hypothetical protein